jgi:hypothetical protein
MRSPATPRRPIVINMHNPANTFARPLARKKLGS